MIRVVDADHGESRAPQTATFKADHWEIGADGILTIYDGALIVAQYAPDCWSRVERDEYCT